MKLTAVIGLALVAVMCPIATYADQDIPGLSIITMSSRRDNTEASYTSLTRVVALANGAIAVSGPLITGAGGNLVSGSQIIVLDPAASIAWAHYLSDGTFERLLPSRDGGLIAAIRTTGKPGTRQSGAALIHFGADGAVLWARKFTTQLAGEFRSVTAAPDGGIYAIGNIIHPKEHYNKSRTDNDHSDPFIVRLDGAGRVIWTKTIETASGMFSVGAAPRPDGGLFVLGGDMLLSVSPDGSVAWGRQLDVGDPRFITWNIAASEHGAVIGGLISRLGHSALDGLAVSVDSTGHLRWARAVDLGPTDRFEDIAAISDGNVVLVGSARQMGHTLEDPVHHGNGWLVELDTKGKLVWSVSAGNERDDFLNAIDVANDKILAVAQIVTDGGARPSLLTMAEPRRGVVSGCQLVTPVDATASSLQANLISVPVRSANLVLGSEVFTPPLSPIDVSLQSLCRPY